MKNENIFLFAIGAIALISLILAINNTITGNVMTGNSIFWESEGNRPTQLPSQIERCYFIDEDSIESQIPGYQHSGMNGEEICNELSYSYCL